MTVLSKIKSDINTVNYFKEFLCYNKPIKKTKIEQLKNVDRLVELPFYEQLSVIKTNNTFRVYAKTVKLK